jgi:polynucleotide 5'-hydroxyl-kinase GRC3/NOL9
MSEAPALHLPDDWRTALARLSGGRIRRTVVLGPPDAGKSSFLAALAQAWTAPEPLALLDLDPGQKLMGPPGTVSLGHADRHGAVTCARFRFIGTTSAIAVRAIVEAAAALGAGSAPFAANTAGFVTGPGARLQAASIAALKVDTVVTLGLAEPPLPAGWAGEVIPLAPSPLSLRKTDGVRRRLRNCALLPYLRDGRLDLLLENIRFDPAPPALFAPALMADARRPLCALADAAGEDMALAVLEAVEEGRVRLRGTLPSRPVAQVRLGRMWVRPGETGWSLADRLEPTWRTKA